MRHLTIIVLVCMLCSISQAKFLTTREFMEQTDESIELLKTENSEIKGLIAELESEIEKLKKEIALLQIKSLPAKETPTAKSRLAKKPIKKKNRTPAAIPTVRDNHNVARQAVVGVYLGESLDSLKKRMWASVGTFSMEDKDHPAKIWTVNTKDTTIKHLLVRTYNNYIYSLYIYFSDASKENYEAIKKNLIKKYKGKAGTDFNEALFGERHFNVTIGGVETQIKLNRDIGFMDDDKLILEYLHLPLFKQVRAEFERRKAEKVRDDL